MEGWIKLSRKLLDWEYFTDGVMLKGWMYLLLKANSEDKFWRGIEVKRGQLVTSLARIAKDLDISVQQARRMLTNMENTHEITRKTTNKFTIITICKFDYYQEGKKGKQQAKQHTNQQANQHADQHANQQQLKNKEEKNIKTSTKVDAKRIFVSPEFENVFAVWLEYKHQRHESYKSDLSLKTCYNKLVKLSGNDPSVAMAIVEQSMANNWAGLFPLKNQNNGNNRTSDWQQTNGAGREQRAAAYMSAVARLAAEDDARAAKVRGA